MYHYTTTNCAIKILGNCQLKYSKYPTINDPFDTGKDIIYDPKDTNGEKFKNEFLNNKILKNTKPMLFEMIKNLKGNETLNVVKKNIEESYFSKMIKNTPFVCFSKNNNIQLLWAHYGEKYAGVVLEFNISRDKAEEVNYKDLSKGPLPSVLTAKKFIEVAFLKNNNKLFSYVNELLLTKHKVWRYEQEIRLLGNPNTNKEYLPFDPIELKGIYFGINHEPNEELIKAITSEKYSHVKIYKMIRDPGFMNIRPIEAEVTSL
ncbi:DUF2971 domain-containing protein [Legionella pneumophila]|uniref:DUF2971 domain-containing protein n=1 Tax=Legionella pneumophila TaxID=446 RepID=UPI000491258F|nr:DUF2971 domain-containing protein [Legionella pneumophila]RYW23087.1 DUF2971 domain-containing protein [Legionella pneumophila]HAT1867500.1 DUF2971 domain-containing protein [Legionella pneumophila]HAT1907630.1 DUF2971 domain-containing protein [Legionella pneumophila]HAT1916480.1 DUF2971 domain-containing protein [Legionella pneumophila]HAT1984448.1 DUF2971 domain-containing protein [Legionella pneumophila]